MSNTSDMSQILKFVDFTKAQQSTISDKNYGKNCYLDNFVFLSPSPS